ncbi:ubiquitin family-domain-containing protein [Cantharellus anzutake]|uniref:ubiquitin family-domain-containing protein n=1 Tax=Cantharellus anzutake TaxID=1750568 RepID=UPI001904D84A|nr:ubiquitin family-domain-containing protein [Cantharellus anzutake]KAF8332719.1 ubiquitin family-domain-containing protein [Cantharellus anzutake]
MVSEASTGWTQNLEVESDDTVSILKTKIQRKAGIPSEQQRFIFNGRQLEDRSTLSDSGIKNEDVIHLAQCRRVTKDQLQC